MARTDLKDLLKKKNPYLFRTKNINTGRELVSALLEARLSSSEEEIIGGFLEELALFVANKTLGAHKSASPGVDFEYVDGGTHYLVSVKSGVNWGNDSQWAAQVESFKRAQRVLNQSASVQNIKCIIGVCYGKNKDTIKRLIIHQKVGQSFWHMISGEMDFYSKIIVPLGYDADSQNAIFNKKKAELIATLTTEFDKEWCDKEGKIKWDEIIKFNSGNLEPKAPKKKAP